MNTSSILTSSFAGRSQQYGESPVHSKGASIAWLREALAPIGAQCLLDLAAGAGHASIHTVSAATKLWAVDPAADMLVEYGRRALASGFSCVTLVHSAAESVPLGTNSIDAIVCRLGMHHVDDVRRALAEVTRLLRRGGVFCLVEHYAGSNCQEQDLLTNVFKLHDESHRHTIDADEYTSLASKAGLQVRDRRTHVREVVKALTLEQWFNLGGTPFSRRQEVQDLLSTLDPELAQRLGFVSHEDKIYFDVPVNMLMFVKD